MTRKKLNYATPPLERIAHYSTHDPATGCLLFEGRRNRDGYGLIIIDYRQYLVHRVVFEDAFGWLPPVVLHKCDHPNCVNPKHLVGGTQADNMADMVKKGRQRAARQNLTPEQVLEVRSTPCKYGSSTELAKKFGVGRTTIDKVRYGETYKNITVKDVVKP